jgi:hypothetical protein
MKKAIRVIQLFGGVIITLFLAGILVPSLMGSTRSANHSNFPGSLHTIKIAGFVFQYKLQNILAALLGTLFGAVSALVMASRAATKKNIGSPAAARSAAGDAGSARAAGPDLTSSFQ